MGHISSLVSIHINPLLNHAVLPTQLYQPKTQVWIDNDFHGEISSSRNKVSLIWKNARCNLAWWKYVNAPLHTSSQWSQDLTILLSLWQLFEYLITAGKIMSTMGKPHPLFLMPWSLNVLTHSHLGITLETEVGKVDKNEKLIDMRKGECLLFSLHLRFNLISKDIPWLDFNSKVHQVLPQFLLQCINISLSQFHPLNNFYLMALISPLKSASSSEGLCNAWMKSLQYQMLGCVLTVWDQSGSGEQRQQTHQGLFDSSSISMMAPHWFWFWHNIWAFLMWDPLPSSWTTQHKISVTIRPCRQ